MDNYYLQHKTLKPDNKLSSILARPLDSFLYNQPLNLPSVGIIVTNYNYAEYIIQCLTSIENQTYKNWNCIIVDDSSTDNSCDSIRKFIDGQNKASQQFSLICNSTNEGQMAAIQKAYGQLNNDFIVIIDADDLLFGDFLENHIKIHLSANIPYAFTCSNQIQIDEKNIVIAGNFSPQTVFEDLTYLPPIALFQNWFWTAMGAAMFRKPLLDLILPVDPENLRICADLYLFSFANVLGGSIIVPELMGCYRRHTKNNFSANRVASGYMWPGKSTKNPDNNLIRNLILKKIEENFEIFQNYLDQNHMKLLIKRIVPTFNQYYEIKHQFKILLKLTGLNVFKLYNENDFDATLRLSGSLPGKFILYLLKVVFRFFSLFNR